MNDFTWWALVAAGVYCWTYFTVFLHEVAHALCGRALGFVPFRIDVGVTRRRWKFHLFGLEWNFGVLPLGGFTFVRTVPSTGIRWRGALFVLAGPGAEIAALALLGWLLFFHGLPPAAHSLGLILAVLTIVSILRSLNPIDLSNQTSPLSNDGRQFLLYLQGKIGTVTEASDAHEQNMRRYDPNYTTPKDQPTVAPAHAERMVQLGAAAVMASDWPAAIKNYEALLNSGHLDDSEKAHVLDLLACLPIYHGAKELLDRAEEWAREACRLAPNSRTLRGTLGSLLVEKGQFGDALELLGPLAEEGNEAVDRITSSFFLAKIYASLGQTDQANTYLDLAYRIARSGTDAEKHLLGYMEPVEDAVRSLIARERHREK